MEGHASHLTSASRQEQSYGSVVETSHSARVASPLRIVLRGSFTVPELVREIERRIFPVVSDLVDAGALMLKPSSITLCRLQPFRYWLSGLGSGTSGKGASFLALVSIEGIAGTLTFSIRLPAMSFRFATTR